MIKIILINIILSVCLFSQESININLKQKDYKFGKDIDIVGIWEIKSENAINFLVTTGYEWKIEFKKDGTIKKIGDEETKKYFPYDFLWKYADDEFVVTKYMNNGMKKNKKTEIAIGLFTNDKFKIKKYIGKKCFMIEIQGLEKEIKMCKIKGNIFLNPSDNIKIQIH
ncbi:MAG: hypothetical protein MR902_08030 [Campylobacter sp.]|nr:hypothetical protein [Campylobacter sp.]